MSEQSICPIGGGCETVLQSRWNRTFGVHNDVLGLLFYLAAMLATALVVADVAPIALWERSFRLALLIAVVMSCRFTYLQWRVIKAWCFWCLMSAVTIGLMAITVCVSGSM